MCTGQDGARATAGGWRSCPSLNVSEDRVAKLRLPLMSAKHLNPPSKRLRDEPRPTSPAPSWQACGSSGLGRSAESQDRNGRPALDPIQTKCRLSTLVCQVWRSLMRSLCALQQLDAKPRSRPRRCPRNRFLGPEGRVAMNSAGLSTSADAIDPAQSFMLHSSEPSRRARA